MPQPPGRWNWAQIAMRGALATIAYLPASSGLATELTAGVYSFSDELGGFRLLSARGSGTEADPVHIVEEISEVAPVTLVIRNHAFDGGRSMNLTLVKHVVNRSVRVWAAFEMELQEIPRRPSVYGDGLSFKQFDIVGSDVTSDAFAQNERRFEPYDRIEFLNGHVDPGATVEFKITLTDPTPTPEFYLVQDPKLLAAQRAAPYARQLAAVERME